MVNIAIFTDEMSLEGEIGNKSLVLIEKSLQELTYPYKVFSRPSMRDDFLNSYKKFDVGIPVIHGGIGEGGQISAMLELLDMPYLFSSHDVHSVCFDKYTTNLLVKDMGYRVPDTYHLLSGDEISKIPFSGPYFIKPTTSGSSLDCGKFEQLSDAKTLIQKILSYDTVCIQELVQGREFTVSVTGEAESARVLGTMEILTEREFFDYDAKYKRDKTKEIFPELPSELEKEIHEESLTIYKKLHLRDIARIDFLYANNTLYFLEVNTIPGLTPTSFYPQCIQHAGYESFAEFLREVISQKIK